MWQSRVEIKVHFDAYFNCTAAFQAPYQTSIKGRAHMHFLDVQISNKSMKWEWAPPLTEVHQYSASKVAMWSKWNNLLFQHELPTHFYPSSYNIDRKRITSISQLSAHHSCIRIVPGVVTDGTPVSIDEHLHSTLTWTWTIPQTHRVGKVTPCENRGEGSVYLNHCATSHNLIPRVQAQLEQF